MNKKKALKKLEKLERNQTDCRFELIQNVLLAFGFEESQPSGGSSHYKYTRNNKIIVIPYAKPIKHYYVKETIQKLEEIIKNEYE